MFPRFIINGFAMLLSMVVAGTIYWVIGEQPLAVNVRPHLLYGMATGLSTVMFGNWLNTRLVQRRARIEYETAALKKFDAWSADVLPNVEECLFRR